MHCHDDLGMSVANSLSAVLAGARQIEGCINGIGERAGNASVEEVATAVRLRPDIYGVWTKIDHSQIYRTSRLVSQLTGMMVQPNKAVVGANAFAHASGIHQDGVLKNTQTFEIINAADVGTENKLVLGKLSGRHAFRVRLEEMGYQLGDEEFKSAFQRFKSLADKKKEVTDRDLESIVADEARMASETFKLDHLQVSSGTSLKPTATVRIAFDDGGSKEATSLGDGPVDAAYRAINEIVQLAQGAQGVPNPGGHRGHRRGRRGPTCGSSVGRMSPPATAPTPTSWSPRRGLTSTPSTSWWGWTRSRGSSPRIRPQPSPRRRPALPSAS